MAYVVWRPKCEDLGRLEGTSGLVLAVSSMSHRIQGIQDVGKDVLPRRP